MTHPINFDATNTERRRWLDLRLACIVLLLLLLSPGCWSAKEDAARLEEIKAVWARLPTYSGLQEIDSSTTSGGGKAMVSKKYRSEARYDDVKRFYVEYLIPDGWTMVSEKKIVDIGTDFGGYHIEFRKGDLSLGLEYAGEKANYEWQYAIAVNWSRWVKKT